MVLAAAVLAAISWGAKGADVPLVHPGFSPAFVIVNDSADSLAFETDSLVVKPHVGEATVFESSHPDRYRLANRRWLRVDGRTKIGRYDLADGRVIAVESKRGYPRPYRIVNPSTRTIFFRIRSNERIAVLVDPPGAPAWTVETARHALIERRATAPAWPHPLATSPDAFEYPRDWYRRAELELARGFEAPIRVTWVAFDSPGEKEIMRTAALRSLGLRAAPVGSPAEPIERPRPPSEEALRLTVRIVGEAVVDPRTGRIEH